MKLVLLEDISDDIACIRASIRSDSRNIDVTEFRSVISFKSAFLEIATNPPKLFILDLMVPYNPLPDQGDKFPKEYARYERIHGFICLEMIKTNPALASIPVIVLSTMPSIKLMSLFRHSLANVHVLQKRLDLQHNLFAGLSEVFDSLVT